MTTTAPKTRTITLTNRPPVKIIESEWPELASAKGDSYEGRDYSRYQQAISQGECDTYSIRVRRHADGRTIVNAVFNAATAWTGSEDRRGGELLVPPGDGPLTPDDGRAVSMDEIVAAIRRVADDCGIPDSVTRDCIASLPPEEI